MELERLKTMIEGGAEVRDVAAAIDNPPLMAARGWPLMDWEYVQAPGMVLFRRWSTPAAQPSPEAAELEEGRRQAQREADELRAPSYHDGEARRRRDRAQNRANRLAGELAELRRREGPPQEAAGELLAALLVVNAPESERHRYEREALATADGRYPVEVVMLRDAPRAAGAPT